MDRLDKTLFNRNIFESREKAKIEILNKNISVNGKIIKKPAYLVNENDIIKVLGHSLIFVGRGGEKLQKAINIFNIDIKNKVAIDVGASTGGFTDCMLKSGIKKVYSIDVGSNQLHKSLKENEKVIVMENTDIREVDLEKIKEDILFFTVDISFISVKKVIESIKKIISKNAIGVILLKPQFEVGKKFVGKNGVVRDKKKHKELLIEIHSYLLNMDINVLNITASPITGKKGNIEYLLHVENNSEEKITFNYNDIVENAFFTIRK